jgi:hypothetical protein
VNSARPRRILDQIRPGDDRLGWSLRHQVDTVTGSAHRGIEFRGL